MELGLNRRVSRNLLVTLFLGQSLVGRIAFAFDAHVSNIDMLRSVMSTVNANNSSETFHIYVQNDIVVDTESALSPGNAVQFLRPANSDPVVIIHGQGHTISRSPTATDEFRFIGIGYPSGGAHKASLELRDLTLSGFRLTTGNSGGALYVNDTGTHLTLNNVTLTDNIVEPNQASGGAIYVTNGAGVSITDSSITGNRAAWYGGGIAANSGAGVNITNSDVSSNFSYQHGGGIYLGDGGLSLQKSIIADNRANGMGGGIYHSNTQSNIQNSTISGNTAHATGGIYARKDSPSGYALQIDTSTISGNSATLNAGGVQSYNQYINLINTTVTNNTGGDAGGISISGEKLFLIGSILAGNSGGNFAELTCSGGTTGPSGENVIANKPGLIGDKRYDFVESFSPNCVFLMGSDTVIASKDGNTPTAIGAVLKPLADNGCDVSSGASGLDHCFKTHGLAENSPALDKNSLDASRIDQRGVAPIGVADLGSFEGFIPDPIDESCYAIRAANGKTVFFCL